MGTNFYLHKNCCNHCNRPEHKIHLGKSSGGWRFLLHIEKLDWFYTDWETCKVEIMKPENEVFDEYSIKQNKEEFIKFTEGKKDLTKHEDQEYASYQYDEFTDHTEGDFS